MARKNKDLAGFNEVANIDINVNDNISNDVNEGNSDTLDQLLKGKKKLQETHVLRGFYIENELANVIDRLGEKSGRGIKSKIVNEALKIIFREKGLM